MTEEMRKREYVRRKMTVMAIHNAIGLIPSVQSAQLDGKSNARTWTLNKEDDRPYIGMRKLSVHSVWTHQAPHLFYEIMGLTIINHAQPGLLRV